MEVHMVADKVADIVAEMVANMVADMEVHMVANKVADMVAGKKKRATWYPADMFKTKCIKLEMF